MNATEKPDNGTSVAHAEPPALPRQHLSSSIFGPQRLEQDVSELLDALIEGQPCDDVRKSLPLFVSEDGLSYGLQECEAKMEQYIKTASSETIKSAAALETIPYLADMVPYPRFVLCAASAQSTGTPVQFLLDTVVGLLHSVLDKNVHVSLGPYKSRSRYWFVGTAETGVGKSPSTKPIVDALLQVLDGAVSLFPGSNADQFHLLQSSTTAAAVNKLRACDGYLVMHTDEAGRCLDLAFAADGKSDAARVVDLSYFLDAAHGSEFSHQTMLDRQEHLKKLKQPVNPHEPVRIPESLCLNPTNVNVLWLQQPFYFGKFWCAVAKNKPIGLVQRFLFSFGSRTHRHDSRLKHFHEHIFLPFVKKLFRFTVKELGPKTPKANKVVFNLSQNHMDMVSHMEQTLSMLGQTKSYSHTHRDAMPMCMYWLGTGLTTNQVVTNGLHSI